MNFKVRLFEDEDELDWTNFVLKCRNCTLYHQMEWKKVIERTYGHKSYYFIAEDSEGNMLGIMPNFFMKSIFFGRQFVSIPFAPYGGPCFKDRDVGKALVNEAIKTGDELNAATKEIRCLYDNDFYDPKLCNQMRAYSSFTIDSSTSVEHIWRNISRKTRNLVRKAIKNNLEFKIESNKGAISEFYSIYSINMRHLGTPSHGLDFFINIYNLFPGRVFISKVLYENRIISALFLIQFRNCLISGWGASLLDYLKFAPNDYIYWMTINFCCENSDISQFDFGRSIVNSGTYKFKKSWGGSERGLTYYYSPASRSVSPAQVKYKRISQLWKLLPFSIHNAVGPMIRKNIA